jgi:fibronectin-binding autotransporter adhesin
MKPTRNLLTVFLGSALLAAVTTANAQTWTGGGADDNWTTAANWTGGTPSTSGTGTSTVTFYDTGATQLTNSTGGRYNLNQIAFNSTAASPVTINVTASPVAFDSGTAIRFNAGTNISVAAGDHKIVGTGVNNGTTYDVIFNGAAGSTHTFDIATGASFEINARIHRGSVTDNKTYAKTGGGTLILSGFNGGSGAWAINATKAFQIQQGAVRFAQNNATGISQNNYVVSSGAAFEIAGVSLQLNNGNVTLNGTGISSGGALRSISGNSILQGNNTIGTIVLASNSSIGVDADSTLTIKKVISGSGDLTKVGAGTLVLDGTLQGTGGAFDNTYTGATTVTAGTLEVRGSIASSSAITNDAALVFNSAAAQAYGNAIGGGGTFAKQGAGTLTLTGNNTYTGATTISSGILQIGAGGTTGTLGGGTNTSSDAFIADGAELRIERSTASSGYSYWGKLSGSGTVNLPAERRMNFRGNQPDSGTLAFQLDGILGVNTFEAATSVHLGGLSGAGTIQRSGNAGGAAILAIGGKGTSSTFDGAIISAELGVEKVGDGTLTLAGANTYGGATTVTAGALLVTGSLGNTAVTVGPDAALGGTGSLAGSLSFAATSFLRVADLANPLAVAGTVSFGSGFGIANLTGIDWDNLTLDTPYTVLDTSQVFGAGDIADFGLANAVAVGSGGRQAYFTDGSLAVVVIPEPAAALLGGLGLLALLRRRR